MLELIDLEKLRSLEPITFDGSQSRGYEMVMANSKKRETERTDLQVKSDHAKGLGFEEVLITTGVFDDHMPDIVEDADTLGDDRFKDFFYKGAPVQIKCVSKLYGNTVYLSQAMWKSCLKATKHNDFFVFGAGEPLGERDQGNTLFSYRPAFVMSSMLVSKVLQWSFSAGEGNKFSLDRLDTKFPDDYQPILKHLL